mgnify:CR=1 FL=1
MDQCRPFRPYGDRLLVVDGLNPDLFGLNPDLQQPAGLIAFVDFAVNDAGSSAHALHFTGP